MISEREIDTQLRDQYIIPFYQKVYDADLPPRIIEHFGQAIRAVPPMNSELGTERWGKLLAQRPDEVNTADVALLINIIFSAPPYAVFETIEEQFEYMEKYEQLRSDYNKMIREFEIKIFQIKDTKMKLSGVTRSANYHSDLKRAEA